MSRNFELGSLQLDADAGVLTRDGHPLPLGGRAVAVLTALVERANECVPKRSIIDAAWPGLVVEESNLAVQVGAIRRVLAEAGGEHRIETLARRGYRFVGTVRPLRERPAAPAERRGTRSNLPAPLSSFVGRERELVEIKRLLPHRRLLTIVGAGGTGKTRLALEIAAEVVDAYRDGAWLVEMASIRDPALAATAVAQALGVRERAGAPLVDAVRAHLAKRNALVILDNCEHLLEACAGLAESLVHGARHLTVLATSREPLRIAGEEIYTLQPLSLPEPGSLPEAIRQSDAVALFVERVRQQLRGFSLDGPRITVVAELCSRLDGIPLALELAAARARSLSIEQIAARLSDRFRLLTSGSRAPQRQQTLRATLDWSYDLLVEAERVLLRRLAIFAGGFTLEAACAAAADSALDEYAAIDVLAQLVSRSLVVADSAAGSTRYRMLETTRCYALEKLVEAEETAACMRRHAAHFRDVFEPAPDNWLRMHLGDWRALYLPEVDNVRAALDWAFDPDGDARIGIALAGTSAVLWPALGLYGEGVRRLERAIAAFGPDTSAMDQARIWMRLAGLLENALLRTHAAIERAIALLRPLGDPLPLGMALLRLGRVLTAKGRFDEAEPVFAEARALLEPLALPKAMSAFWFEFAYLKSFSGDARSARAYYGRALAIDRESGDETAVVAALGNVANADWALGDLDAAMREFREQIAIARASPSATRLTRGWALMTFSGLLTERGDIDDAASLQREGLPIVRDEDCAWLFLYDVALCAALHGRVADAGLIAGAADAAHAALGAARTAQQVRTRDRLLALLTERQAEGETDRLLAEGARLSVEEACRIALAL